MQVLKKTHIRISIDNKELLEEKKRKLRLNSLDKVISVLLQKEEELSIVKKVEKRKKTKAMPIEKPKVELPSLNGKCVFKHERQDGKTDCAKDFREKTVLHVVTNEQCTECWNNAIHVSISD